MSLLLDGKKYKKIQYFFSFGVAKKGKVNKKITK